MRMHTIGTDVARRMALEKTLKGAAIVGRPGAWRVMLRIGGAEKLLGSQHADRPRTWVSLDTCMRYLMQELHIQYVDGVDATNDSTTDAVPHHRPDTAARMRRTHEAAIYDAWFRAQVQQALDEAGPGVPHEQVMADAQAAIDRATKLRRNAGT